MVKRTSCLASNEMFQVRILVELLDMVSVVYVVRTPACEAGQCLLRRGGFDSRRIPLDYRSVLLGSKRPPKPPSSDQRCASVPGFLALLLDADVAE